MASIYSAFWYLALLLVIFVGCGYGDPLPNSGIPTGSKSRGKGRDIVFRGAQSRVMDADEDLDDNNVKLAKPNGPSGFDQNKMTILARKFDIQGETSPQIAPASIMSPVVAFDPTETTTPRSATSRPLIPIRFRTFPPTSNNDQDDQTTTITSTAIVPPTTATSTAVTASVESASDTTSDRNLQQLAGFSEEQIKNSVDDAFSKGHALGETPQSVVNIPEKSQALEQMINPPAKVAAPDQSAVMPIASDFFNGEVLPLTSRKPVNDPIVSTTELSVSASSPTTTAVTAETTTETTTPPAIEPQTQQILTQPAVPPTEPPVLIFRTISSLDRDSENNLNPETTPAASVTASDLDHPITITQIPGSFATTQSSVTETSTLPFRDFPVTDSNTEVTGKFDQAAATTLTPAVGTASTKWAVIEPVSAESHNIVRERLPSFFPMSTFSAKEKGDQILVELPVTTIMPTTISDAGQQDIPPTTAFPVHLVNVTYSKRIEAIIPKQIKLGTVCTNNSFCDQLVPNAYCERTTLDTGTCQCRPYLQRNADDLRYPCGQRSVCAANPCRGDEDASFCQPIATAAPEKYHRYASHPSIGRESRMLDIDVIYQAVFGDYECKCLPRALGHDHGSRTSGICCKPGRLMCHDLSGCYSLEEICDGRKQCQDCSDETYKHCLLREACNPLAAISQHTVLPFPTSNQPMVIRQSDTGYGDFLGQVLPYRSSMWGFSYGR